MCGRSLFVHMCVEDIGGGKIGLRQDTFPLYYELSSKLSVTIIFTYIVWWVIFS